MKYAFAPPNPDIYNNLAFGPFQGTGGSTAISSSWMHSRNAGAAVPEMMLQVSAAEWNVDASELTPKDGLISGAGKSKSMGAFVYAAAAHDVPLEPCLKDPTDFTVIGKEGHHRLDPSGKNNGTTTCAMDIQLPTQMVVMIKRSSRKGGLVASFYASADGQAKAFIHAASVPNKAGIAIYAEKIWSDFQARDLIVLAWGPGHGAWGMGHGAD
ncbi:MAG: hypothetical protein AB8B58_14225 [Roseobacter sp.]